MREMRFEAPAVATELVGRFDLKTSAWDLPMAGDFWEAIKLAHRGGFRGKGRTIAIVDSAFDLSIPMLHDRTRSRVVVAPAGERSDHGTAVALLIATIAPEARLDLYEVSRGGLPDMTAVTDAIAQAASSDVDVINLSLGLVQDFNSSLAASTPHGTLDELVLAAIQNKQKLFGSDNCELCRAAAGARTAGKVLVAAAGNEKATILCPARSDSVISCGFNGDDRVIVGLADGLTELSRWAEPSYSQSPDADMTITQPAGMLGTSFAAPLVTGAAAIGTDGPAFPDHFTQLRASAIADQLMALPEFRDTNLIQALYLEALRRHPHLHKPDASGPPCVECGVICQALYVNGGYFLLNCQQFEAAEVMLRIGRWIAPWSPHAAANLGRVMQERAATQTEESVRRAMLQEALDLYDAALRLKPQFQPYELQRAVIANLISEIA